MTLVTILCIILAWFVGIAAAAVLLAPPIIIVVFGIPFTYEMKRNGVLTSTVPARRYLVSFVLLLGVFALITWGVWAFFRAYSLWYVIAALLTLLLNLRKCGRSRVNVAEFFQTNAKYVDKDALSRWMAAEGNLR
jgi:hypothetical protein